jgi:hypothetical protein
MPTFWITVEAPGIIDVRVAILWLQRVAERVSVVV